MAVLLDLLHPYPILENLSSRLFLGDLFNLSKVNSVYRASLHGFERPRVDTDEGTSNSNVRTCLLIGAHRTSCWENLKARSQTQCSEFHHKRGSNPLGCLMCSMPVCEACIIKASFAKRNENTFQNRYRSLCADCWTSGNRHKKHPTNIMSGRSPKPYRDRAFDGEFCSCTAKDGHLCIKCKTEQNTNIENEVGKCYGEQCPNGNTKSITIPMEGRVCLWCSRQLPGSHRAESQRAIDEMFLRARSHSSYDPFPEEEHWDSFEEQRMLELDALSRRKEDIRRGVTSGAASHAYPQIGNSDSSGDKLERESSAEFAIHSREEERWQRSESSRRHEGTSATLQRTFDLPRYEDHNNDRVAITDEQEHMAIAAADHAMLSPED